MTRRPEPQKPPTVALALLIALLLAGSLIAMIAIVLPGVLLMVISGGLLLLMFVAQYFLWARWLYPIVVRMEQDPGTSLNSSLPEPESETVHS